MACARTDGKPLCIHVKHGADKTDTITTAPQGVESSFSILQQAGRGPVHRPSSVPHKYAIVTDREGYLSNADSDLHADRTSLFHNAHSSGVTFHSCCFSKIGRSEVPTQRDRPSQSASLHVSGLTERCSESVRRVSCLTETEIRLTEPDFPTQCPPQ